jgi:hypothetical protein
VRGCPVCTFDPDEVLESDGDCSGFADMLPDLFSTELGMAADTPLPIVLAICPLRVLLSPLQTGTPGRRAGCTLCPGLWLRAPAVLACRCDRMHDIAN